MISLNLVPSAACFTVIFLPVLKSKFLPSPLNVIFLPVIINSSSNLISDFIFIIELSTATAASNSVKLFTFIISLKL
ncbi:hypothetical protein [Clostridium saudiense]|uniref:hypothetical protein n=1 Tax=Clostridium saudiense TaxID=1414720 RepID=UPI001A9B36C6|nr:hypothetical protein [Clostridium saudiense]